MEDGFINKWVLVEEVKIDSRDTAWVVSYLGVIRGYSEIVCEMLMLVLHGFGVSLGKMVFYFGS